MKRQILLCALLLAGLPFLPVRTEAADKPDTLPYLGVATAPVDPMLSRHLKLRPGTGLLVQMVDKGSAADGVLKEEDILTDLDGQLLVNPEQFVTLVRLQKPGQEIALKLLREGAAQTVKVKLGEREAIREPPPRDDAWDDGFPFPRRLRDPWGMPAFPQPNRGGPGGQLKLKPGESNVQVQRRSESVIVEDGRRAELTDDESVRRFKVTDEDGKVLFDGEVKGDADVAKMPKIARELYDRMSDNTKIEIKPPRKERGDPAGRVDT